MIFELAFKKIRNAILMVSYFLWFNLETILESKEDKGQVVRLCVCILFVISQKLELFDVFIRPNDISLIIELNNTMEKLPLEKRNVQRHQFVCAAHKYLSSSVWNQFLFAEIWLVDVHLAERLFCRNAFSRKLN